MEENDDNALSQQYGGSHYKDMAIQPMEFSEANNLSAGQHTAIKYICRHENKHGLDDLRKAIHSVRLLAWLHYGEKI